MKTKLIVLLPFLLLSSVIWGQGCFLGVGATSINNTINTSGNAIVDQVTIREFNQLVNIYGLRPNFIFFREQGSPNAYAMPRITNPNQPHGTILLGLNLIQSECSQSASGTCSSIPIILAHEFGHIIDFNMNLPLNGKYRELFADYIAGSYLFHRAHVFGWLNINEVSQSFYNKGNYDFNNPDFHGTPQERVAALSAGCYLSQQYNQAGQHLTLQNLVNSAMNELRKF